jgi:nucleoside-diphosphate-sugar epimerase
LKQSPLPPDVYPPSRYIEKVSLLTGEVMEEEILPKQLLVNHHRDFHVMDVYARFLMSRAIRRTGDQEAVEDRMRSVRKLGKKAIDMVGSLLGERGAKALGKSIFGFKTKEYFFRYRNPPLPPEQAEKKVQQLRKVATERLQKVTVKGQPRFRVLLTGGTGFLGKEIIAQAANDAAVAEMIIVIRPKEIKDRKTKQVVKVISPAERGAELLDQLWLTDHPARTKFRFVAGDIEEPGLGISNKDKESLGALTHVIHCAASVSFDDTYDNSFRANVRGALNALAFSQGVHKAAGSKFIAHLSIETSYIHGRQAKGLAREDQIAFPRNFYNNYYELTKAFGSIETDEYMLKEGLPVAQLCPAIVVGDAHTGNNRGDTKVVNAPVNTFGRAKEALEQKGGTFAERSKAWMLAQFATVFPGDPSAEMNLVPVDRVVAGILSALGRVEAVGSRVHLATDNRLKSESILKIARDEIEVDITLAEPTLHRTVTMPLLTKVLTALDQPRLAGALKTLGTIFGGYSEYGQPVHEVGNDVEILGLPLPRPNSEHVFRMVCRHNRYVQNFGQIKDLNEISRREKLWARFLAQLEERTGKPAANMTAAAFRKALEAEFDLATFNPLAPRTEERRKVPRGAAR